MRVTSKGQVTIPLQVRKELGIQPHTEIDFIRQQDGTYKLVKVGKAKSRFASLCGVATVKMSTDEILALTRD